jgi:hypothetical protein
MDNLHGCTCHDNTWTAVLDLMPPRPGRLTVNGSCTCPTGGFKASLKKAEPQGINKSILLLELETVAPTGIVNQQVTNYDVQFVEEGAPEYDKVEIRPCGVTIPIEIAR